MGGRDTCVFTASGEFDAQQIKAFLQAHDIPCEFKGEALRLTHGLTLDGLGEVEVHVPPELVERARDLLARVEAGELRLDEHAVPSDSPDEPPSE
jgi:hypothetical protein